MRLATNVGWIFVGCCGYLKAAGIGIVTEYERLDCGPEWVTETYYDVCTAPSIDLGFSYQLAVSSAYNADGGPAHLFVICIRIAS